LRGGQISGSTDRLNAAVLKCLQLGAFSKSLGFD
jgi:hypothetical protein